MNLNKNKQEKHTSRHFNGNFEDLPLDSPERPIQILDTVDAGVPQASKRFLDHKVDKVRFPNGNEGYHHRLVIPEGVMLAHVDDNDEIVLVNNFRHALGRHSVELPSGAVEESEASLLEVISPDDAEVIVSLAREQGKSIMDFLGPDQIEEVLKSAAARETREEVGFSVDPSDIERLVPKALRGSVGYAGQTYNIFYGAGGGKKVSELHDDGEEGILKHKRVPIEDAVEMIGHEIVDPATSTALNALAQMYGVRPSWLPKVKNKQKSS